MNSQVIIFVLMVNAACVAYGLAHRKNMWKWIVLYWMFLTYKNYSDFIALA